jgi:hypothetical protein
MPIIVIGGAKEVYCHPISDKIEKIQIPSTKIQINSNTQ